ncbi:MAG: DUF4338 domain-containing protein [Deltaproteobacteria bacterium]|nr:DUF4338 domain-containing protein [Deltaproteobacteria bacterium]
MLLSMIDGSHKELVVFRYRGKDLTADDITFINEIIERDHSHGRSYIARQLCEVWQWRQPNGNFKEYAARDLLLRLEENGFILLPVRKRPKNNSKIKSFDQFPLFLQKPLEGMVGDHPRPVLRELRGAETYLWDFLIHHYHYLGLPTLVGEHLKQVATIDGQIVACLGWASSAWKVRDRDTFIGWDQATRRQNLHLIANNVRFLIPEWVRIKHLASKVLSLSLSCLNERWLTHYGHGLALAETFVDSARFKGTCYRAANWIHVGQTSGSAKKGNVYRYHGQPKAIYLYPLHRNFRRVLCHDPR